MNDNDRCEGSVGACTTFFVVHAKEAQIKTNLEEEGNQGGIENRKEIGCHRGHLILASCLGNILSF